MAGSAGVLEATGSLLYMRSASEGRLDVAAVLASLYPVVTILLDGVVFEGTDDVESGAGNGVGPGRRSAGFAVEDLLYFRRHFRLWRDGLLLYRIRSSLNGILKAPHPFAQTLAQLGQFARPKNQECDH